MIILLLFGIALAVANSQNIQVTTVEGTIEGYTASEGYYTFHGIPYAMSRTGLDMFKPSVPSPAFPGLFHAYDSSIQCAQPSRDGMVGIVNCLVLNVFTSNVTTSKPVLVWLNGEESNPTVSSHYSFKRLIDEDIVVVTLNYRLSVFGFLCLRTEQHPGNAGLKDIILGLQWIQRNIAGFGGDPQNVVLMGHGSAAAMAELITLTPQSENLVHKAIALSGTALAPWAVSYDPIGAALTLNADVGGGLQTIDDIAVFLSYRTPAELNDALNKFRYTNNTQMFAPCIENAGLEGALLIDAPINLIREVLSYKDIPYLAGYVTREGTKRATEALEDRWLEQMHTNFTDFLPVDLDFGNDQETNTENIRNFYFGTGPINTTSLESYLNYHGDSLIVVPMIRGLRERIRTTVRDVFLFEMGYSGTNNTDWTHSDIPLTGARHGSLLNYIFDFDLTFYMDERLAESFVKRIATFANTGYPDDSVFTRPLPITTQSFNYLSVTGSGESGSLTQRNLANPQNGVMTFWDPLYETYYNAPSSAAGLTAILSVVLFSFILLTVV